MIKPKSRLKCIIFCFQLILNLFYRIVKGLIEAGMNLERDYDGMKGEELIYQVKLFSAYKCSAVHKDLTLKNQDNENFSSFFKSNYHSLFCIQLLFTVKNRV